MADDGANVSPLTVSITQTYSDHGTRYIVPWSLMSVYSPGCCSLGAGTSPDGLHRGHGGDNDGPGRG